MARGAVSALVLAVAFPLYWVAVSSLAPEARLFAEPSLLPDRIVLDHYTALFRDRNFWVPIRNSLVVAGSTTLLCLVLGAPCAYALARLRFRGKALLLSFVLAVAMFPQISIVSPLYLLLRTVGLLDTYPGLVLPYLTFAMPLAVWLLTVDGGGTGGAVAVDADGRIGLALAQEFDREQFEGMEPYFESYADYARERLDRLPSEIIEPHLADTESAADVESLPQIPEEAIDEKIRHVKAIMLEETDFDRASNASYGAGSILDPFLEAAQEGDAPANVISDNDHEFAIKTAFNAVKQRDGMG
jgi:hypothetical protein